MINPVNALVESMLENFSVPRHEFVEGLGCPLSERRGTVTLGCHGRGAGPRQLLQDPQLALLLIAQLSTMPTQRTVSIDGATHRRQKLVSLPRLGQEGKRTGLIDGLQSSVDIGMCRDQNAYYVGVALASLDQQVDAVSGW